MEPQETRHALSDIIVEALKAKGMNLVRLSELTDVPENVLGMLLEEKYEKLPAVPYIRGYILRIAQVLNLDGERLWTEYLKDRGEIKRPGTSDVLPQNRFRPGRWPKKTVAVATIVVLVFGYIIFRLPGLLGTPSFEISSVPATVTSPNLTIQGKMNPADQLTLNGQVIYPDKNGGFSETLTLQPGFNTFVFAVKKIMGQTYTVTKQVFYNSSSSTNDGGTTARPTSTGITSTTSIIH